MDVIEAIHRRRSIRAYQAAPVARALIEEVVWAAVQAPTPPASGDSPFAVCAVEGADRLADYGLRAKEYARNHQPEGQRWAWAERPDFQVFWGAPALVLICGRSGNSGNSGNNGSGDSGGSNAGSSSGGNSSGTSSNSETAADCCRAGQNLMLAAHARGLGSCWVGAPLPWLCSSGVADELGLPQGYKAVVAMILGYAAESPAGSPRPRPAIHWCSPEPTAPADWEARVAALWQRADALSPTALVAAADALADERAPDDAAAMFERASARDRAGIEAEAETYYRAALASGRLDAYRSARASIQLASTLRILGQLDASAALLVAQLGRPLQTGQPRALHDEARAILALTYVAQGRAVEAAGLALYTLAPHLSRYNRSVSGNAAELVGQTWD